jgi:hypothetical protein
VAGVFAPLQPRPPVGGGKDFEFKPNELINKVRSVRLTSLKDEGDLNGSQDIALGELLIE